jgi:hypothetical protein
MAPLATGMFPGLITPDPFAYTAIKLVEPPVGTTAGVAAKVVIWGVA